MRIIRNNIKMLKAIFNKHEQEAKTFEERTGLSGISREYSLPRDLTPEKLAKCLISPMFNAFFDNFTQNVKRLTQQFSERSDLNNSEKLNSWHEFSKAQLLKEIIELNPELKAVEYYEDIPKEVDTFLVGIASGYNGDDIQHALEAFHDYRHFREINPKIKSIADDIQSLTGHRPEWMVSQKTHEYIKNLLTDSKPECN